MGGIGRAWRIRALGASCALVLLAGVVAAATVDDPDDVAATERTTTTSASTTTTRPRSTTTSSTFAPGTTTSTTAAGGGASTTATTSGGPAPPATSGTATVDGVEVTVTPDAIEVGAGSRLWFDITVRNVGSEPFAWMSAGCGILAAGWLVPAGHDGTTPPASEGWDGEDPAALPAWVEAHNTMPSAIPSQPEEFTAWRSIACTSDFGTTDIPPGGMEQERHSVAVRLLPGSLPAGGRFDLIASFEPWSPEGTEATLRERVVASVPITVTDDPARGGGDAGAALDAFATDRRLADWLDQTSFDERPDIDQRYRTELSWWRGAWELWVTPTYFDEGDGELRMRYDPVEGRVVDVRQVFQGRPPQDEPDAVRDDNPDVPPDDVRPGVDDPTP